MATAPPPRINVISATLEELQQISGIGPRIAQSIVDFRNNNNGEINSSQLASIPHIRPCKEMWDCVCFDKESEDISDAESEIKSSNGEKSSNGKDTC